MVLLLWLQASRFRLTRDIEAEGIADKLQFEEERHPYKAVQFMQSLLQGLPIATQFTYTQPQR